MTAVARLVTFVDVNEQQVDTVSVSARHEAELVDGGRVLLLDDRGWGSSEGWAETSVDDIEETARVVVGPDEPFDGRTYEDMEASHWAYLQRKLQRQGVAVDVAELRRAPHDVVLSQRVRGRIQNM